MALILTGQFQVGYGFVFFSGVTGQIKIRIWSISEPDPQLWSEQKSGLYSFFSLAISGIGANKKMYRHSDYCMFKKSCPFLYSSDIYYGYVV